MGKAGSTRPRYDVYRSLHAALLASLPLIGAATSDAQSPVKQILVLQSVNRGNLTLDAFTSQFRTSLDQRAGDVNVVQIVVGPTGFVGAPEQAVVDYIRSIYTNRPAPDLVMTVAGPAAVFARKYRQQLFPANAAPLRGDGSAVPSRRATRRERERGYGRKRFASPDRRHPAGASRDPAGLHGDRVRTYQPLHASRVRDRVRAISRSRELHLVRPVVASGNPSTRREPATPLGDRVRDLRHGRAGSVRTRPIK